MKWLLELEVRWKNALSLLIALACVALIYFGGRHSNWFHELADRGNGAILLLLAAVLISAFLAAFLVLTAAAAPFISRRAAREAEEAEFAALLEIEAKLGSLTNWQRAFLVRFIVDDTMQIKEWDVGSYEAVWGPEVDVLVSKGIIRRHRGGVLEIAREYWQFLQAFWDRETGTLRPLLASKNDTAI